MTTLVKRNPQQPFWLYARDRSDVHWTLQRLVYTDRVNVTDEDAAVVARALMLTPFDVPDFPGGTGNTNMPVEIEDADGTRRPLVPCRGSLDLGANPCRAGRAAANAAAPSARHRPQRSPGRHG